MQVTFLPKNSITVTADELQSPAIDRSANYHKIQVSTELYRIEAMQRELC